MIPHLLTTRVYTDADTGINHSNALGIPYHMICPPIEDVSNVWDEYEQVTKFHDEYGNTYHVLEPFAKIFDMWLQVLEQGQYKSITFSQQ